MLLSTRVYTYLFRALLSILLGVYTEVELLGALRGAVGWASTLGFCSRCDLGS